MSKILLAPLAVAAMLTLAACGGDAPADNAAAPPADAPPAMAPAEPAPSEPAVPPATP